MISKLVLPTAAIAIASAIFLVPSVMAQNYGGTLKIGVDVDLKTANFAKTSGNSHAVYAPLVSEGLVNFDMKCNVVPALATHWDISKDAKTFTFHIRKGVKFHNGRELTAADVKKTISWHRKKKNRSKSRGRYKRGGVSSKRIKVLDRYTVQFKLKTPSVSLPVLFNSRKSQILAPESLTSKPPRPIGTGPFKFVEWKPRQYTKMVRNEHYWRKDKNGKKLPYVDKLIIKPIIDGSTRYLALKSGDIHWANSIPLDKIPNIKKNPPKWMTPGIKAGSRWWWFQMQQKHKGPLRDKRVRMAIAHAFDKQAIMDGLTWGMASVENQVFPPGTNWYFKNLPDPYKKANVKKAKALLAEAGFAKGLTLNTIVRNRTEVLNFATLAQAQLKKVGINLKLRVMDYGAHRKTTKKKKYDTNVGHYSFQPDPHWRYQTQFSTGARSNNPAYSNKEVDKLMKKAAGELDKKKRRAMYRKVVELINKDVVVLFFGHQPIAQASRKELKNFVTNCNGDTQWAYGGASNAWFVNPSKHK